MLLAINAGNTNVSFAVCDPQKLDDAGRARWIGPWRMATHPPRTEDEVMAFLCSCFNFAGVELRRVTGIAISCVVPRWSKTLEALCLYFPGSEILMINSETDTGLNIEYDPPEDLGPDRLVNAAAAWHLYPGASIVVDFGTATTFDVVSSRGTYLGGAISPGIEISVEALAQRGARLFRVDYDAPPTAIGKSSRESLQSGIVYGFVAQAEGMVRRLQSELGEEARVLATGGLAGIIAPRSPLLETVEKHLTLEGLRLLWQRARS